MPPSRSNPTRTNKMSLANIVHGHVEQHRTPSPSPGPSTAPPMSARGPRRSLRLAAAAATSTPTEVEEVAAPSGTGVNHDEVDLERLWRESRQEHAIEELQCSVGPNTPEYRVCAEVRAALIGRASRMLSVRPCAVCRRKGYHEMADTRHLKSHLCKGHKPFKCKFPRCEHTDSQPKNMDIHFLYHKKNPLSSPPPPRQPRRRRRARRARRTPTPPRETPSPALLSPRPTSHSSPATGQPVQPRAGPSTFANSSNTPSGSTPSGSSLPRTPPTPSPEDDEELVGPMFERHHPGSVARHARPRSSGGDNSTGCDFSKEAPQQWGWHMLGAGL
ncbi:hypothetical protein BDW22DRAFT_1431890 [Trametopsis cervina]|nr:hypothetical protein BDW22DRAFT_1431890 [Trametopsis cervina]